MNVFVVNTPFQHYVVRKIVEQYFSSADNMIISTISGNSGHQEANTVTISHGVRGLPIARKVLRRVRRNVHSTCFYIPHLGNLFSSVFYKWAKRYHRPISVYYEGVALFYDPVIPNHREKRKRLLQGLLLGVCYKHYEQLYPDELLNDTVCCYSPVLSPLLDKYKSVRKIDFLKKDMSMANSNILLLTSDEANDDEINSCVSDVKGYVNGSDQIIYIKPHYALSPDKVNLYVEKLREIGDIQVNLLDKHIPIEELFDEISFKHVICQRFTSSIINMSFIFGNNIICRVTEKESVPMEMINELGIEIC